MEHRFLWVFLQCQLHKWRSILFLLSVVRDRNGIKLFFTALSRHAIRCGYFKGGVGILHVDLIKHVRLSAPCRCCSLSVDIIVLIHQILLYLMALRCVKSYLSVHLTLHRNKIQNRLGSVVAMVSYLNATVISGGDRAVSSLLCAWGL